MSDRPHRAGVIPSPNLWRHPETYETEVACFDPDGLVDAAVQEVADWRGRDLLDVGCGSGHQLPRFAREARSVRAVEPHAPSRALARRRTARLPDVEVLDGVAQRLPLPDSCVDVAHARWAYFFGPGCEPGLRELDRVVRRGGCAVVVDNDATRSTFGRWFRRSHPRVDAGAVQRFWSTRGWTRVPVLTRWRFATRADLEAVLRIELDPVTATDALAEHHGVEVDYAVDVWFRRRP